MFKQTKKIDIVSWWICWWAVLSSWQIEIASFCCKTSKLVCKTCQIYTVKAWSTHEAWLWKNPYSVLIQDVIQGFHRNNVLFILVLLEAVVLKLRVNQYVSSLITYTKIPTLFMLFFSQSFNIIWIINFLGDSVYLMMVLVPRTRSLKRFSKIVTKELILMWTMSEWYFLFTSHGNNPCNGVSGTL